MDYEIYEEDRETYEALSGQEQERFDEVVREAFNGFGRSTAAIVPNGGSSGMWMYCSPANNRVSGKAIRVRKIEETEKTDPAEAVEWVNSVSICDLPIAECDNPGQIASVIGITWKMLRPDDPKPDHDELRDYIERQSPAPNSLNVDESDDPDEPEVSETSEVSDEERIKRTAYLFAVLLWHRDNLSRWQANDIKGRFIESCHTPKQAERRLLALLGGSNE